MKIEHIEKIKRLLKANSFARDQLSWSGRMSAVNELVEERKGMFKIIRAIGAEYSEPLHGWILTDDNGNKHEIGDY